MAQHAVGSMAEGHVIEQDGRRWTIRLREGLRFHDGEGGAGPAFASGFDLAQLQQDLSEVAS